jgi:rifampicin phosphotransferase
MKPYILPLSDLCTDLETVGGKGLSLAKLSNAGLPVPDGFHVTTEAYCQFVAANDLQPKIQAALRMADPALPVTLETASATIGSFFADSNIPADISSAITAAYDELNHQSSIAHHNSVAVRSSATAEDLPEASFAGQQETYLNIRGEAALLAAVKKCWGSLWTARAIAYRMKNNIDQNTVALAVVVQEMVNAEAAGILFTANPINGRRDEMVINAAWGLGEAIVGGLVSPDMIVADRSSGKIKTLEIAEKTVITALTESGTREEPLDDARRSSQVLSDAQVVELVAIARRIEEFYGKPQDIEWCEAQGKFYIVQSRPITTLTQVPLEWSPPDPKGTYMRTSAADLMPKPLSPLFRTLGIPAQVEQMQPLGKRLLGADPVLAKDYFTSVNSYAYMNAYISPRSWWWVLTGMLPAYPRLLRRLVPLWREELHPEYQAFVDSKKDLFPAEMSAGELWHEAKELANAAAYYICGLMFATMGASAGSEMLLTRVYEKFARHNGDPDASTLLMGWDNIPVRSEKSLYDMALWINEDRGLAEYVLSTPSHNLTMQLDTPDTVALRKFSELATRFQAHLEKFGHIIFQLDFAADLPLDHPEPMLLENIKMYLRGEGANPHERQHASQQKRIQTGETPSPA